MNLLGIDYGLKRVGLAISNGFLADPLSVINNSKNLTVNICQICSLHEIDKIIIGLPGRSKMSELVKKFVKQLQKSCSLPIVFWDETLTSVEAEKFTKDKSKIDSLAAAIILQSYIDENDEKK